MERRKKVGQGGRIREQEQRIAEEAGGGKEVVGQPVGREKAETDRDIEGGEGGETKQKKSKEILIHRNTGKEGNPRKRRIGGCGREGRTREHARAGHRGREDTGGVRWRWGKGAAMHSDGKS